MFGGFVSGTISVTTFIAVSFGVIFLLLLLVFAFVIYLWGRGVPHTVTVILRTILALCAGAIGWIIGGEISTSFNLGILSGNAAGSIGLAVLVYLVNPPAVVERQINPAAPVDSPPQPVTERRQRSAATTGAINE
ncbi:hypothetical protein [Bradyrhizobium liaoningense]